MPPVRALLLLSLPMVGCAVGTSVRDFEPAHRPEGVHATVRVRGTVFSGELLEVKDTGLLILRDRRRLVRVPFTAIGDAHFTGAHHCELSDGVLPTAGVRRRLRLLSRFPQGLTPELLERLLAAHGQTAPEAVRP